MSVYLVVLHSTPAAERQACRLAVPVRPSQHPGGYMLKVKDHATGHKIPMGSCRLEVKNVKSIRS
jgi:hypothetical protein